MRGEGNSRVSQGGWHEDVLPRQDLDPEPCGGGACALPVPCPVYREVSCVPQPSQEGVGPGPRRSALRALRLCSSLCRSPSGWELRTGVEKYVSRESGPSI